MNKRIKVLVSAVLATVMLVLCIPFTAAAASATALEIGKGYTISAANANGILYITGTVTSGRFDASLTAADAAVFYVEAATNANEYLLYFMNGETKTYVVMADKSQGGSTTTDKTVATVFEWNTEKNTLAVAEDSNNRAFGAGATSTYNNFSCYDLSGNYNWGQFTAVDTGSEGGSGNEGGNTGSGSEGTGSTGTPAPEVGKGYTISAANANGTLYATGTVTGGRFDGTLTAADATVFYIEAAANAGEYYLYYMNGEAKTYIVMGDKTTEGDNTTDKTTATVFEWNATLATLVVAEDSNNRAFGTSSTSTYNNFSAYDAGQTGYNWGAFTAVNTGSEGGSGTQGGGTGSGNEGTTGGSTTNPDTNDSVVAYIAVAVVALFGLAYVSKKH